MKRYWLPCISAILTFAVGVFVSIAVHGTSASPEINPIRLVHPCFDKGELRHEPEARTTLKPLGAECGAAYSHPEFPIETTRSKKFAVATSA